MKWINLTHTLKDQIGLTIYSKYYGIMKNAFVVDGKFYVSDDPAVNRQIDDVTHYLKESIPKGVLDRDVYRELFKNQCELNNLKEEMKSIKLDIQFLKLDKQGL